MVEFSVDWTKQGNELLEEIVRWRRHTLIQEIETCEDLIREIESRDVFDAKKFRQVRRRTGTQQDWAEVASVSAGTISNYENNKTSPNRAARKVLVDAAKIFRDRKKAILAGQGKTLAVDVDPVEAKDALEKTILNAALTDFKYDPSEQKIIAVPFSSDERDITLSEIAEDRKNLLISLSAQCVDISNNVSISANANLVRIVAALGRYNEQVLSQKPNPRLLYRLGTTISRAVSNEYISVGLNDFDRESLQGFLEDHTELMRLYYKEALAKAQQIDAVEIDEEAELPRSTDFNDIARAIEAAVDEDGERVFDGDITTLVRDIAKEIEENEEAEILTDDPERRKALRRRRIDAIKNGSVLVGRFLFFTSFFVVVDPTFAWATATGMAGIIGAVEQVSPGTVRSYYEKLRDALPFLPKFPTDKRS